MQTVQKFENYIELEFDGYALVPPFEPGTGARLPLHVVKEMLANNMLCRPIHIDGTVYIIIGLNSLKIKREGKVVRNEWRLLKEFWGEMVAWNPLGETLPCVIVGLSQTHSTVRALCDSPRAEEGLYVCRPRVEVTYPANKLFPANAQLNFTMTSVVDLRTKRTITIGTRLTCVPEEVVVLKAPEGGYYFKARRARCWLA